ncbi:MAG TPA: PepSY domain-containing protein [Beijerinckiaceae bacterium]|nr:PepSY domain-containing protein [Beijerinckiaceae bacterium]
MKLIAAASASLAALAGVGVSLWPQTCTSTPPRHWLTPLEVEARLRESGLKLQSLRTGDDRCFAVVARDRQGRLRDLVVNPADGMIVREAERG